LLLGGKTLRVTRGSESGRQIDKALVKRKSTPPRESQQTERRKELQGESHVTLQ